MNIHTLTKSEVAYLQPIPAHKLTHTLLLNMVAEIEQHGVKKDSIHWRIPAYWKHAYLPTALLPEPDFHFHTVTYGNTWGGIAYNGKLLGYPAQAYTGDHIQIAADLLPA